MRKKVKTKKLIGKLLETFKKSLIKIWAILNKIKLIEMYANTQWSDCWMLCMLE